MEREVRYCTTDDGVRIAYCVEGEGPPLLWCPIFVESFALVDGSSEWSRLMEYLRERWTVITYDTRGTGLSDRGVSDFTCDALVGDMDAVVRDSGYEHLSVAGNVMSGPRAIAFSSANPDVVTRLLLYDTFASAVESYPQTAAKALADLCRANWAIGAQTVADMGGRRNVTDPAERERLAEAILSVARVYENSTTGSVAAAVMLEAYETWDVSALLPSLSQAVMLVHHLQNPVVPVAQAQKMAAAIPSVRLVTLDGSAASPLFEMLPALPTPVEQFLPQPEPPSRPHIATTPLRTVLFTDIAGSTEMMQRLGDVRGREVLREHERITREVLKTHGGTEVKTMGDGFMASFGSVTKAVECAIALQRAFEERNASLSAHSELVEGEAARPTRASGRAGPGREPLSVRIGLNAGEPIEEQGDLFGATVILASRIAAKAEGGEVLASMAVRELCAGKGFSFADRGEFVAKGFEDAVRVYEVRWRE